MKLEGNDLHNLATRLANEAQTDVYLKVAAIKQTLDLSNEDATMVNLQSLVYLRSALDQVLQEATSEIRTNLGPATAARAVKMIERGLDGVPVTDVRIKPNGDLEVKDRPEAHG